ncbi:33513_t:CDS:2, partial [Racocetra persica]
GLFGTIREMGGDSSMQTVQSYGYVINKLTITMQMISEIKSLNYDYQTILRFNKQNLNPYYCYKDRVEILSTFSHQIFQELLNDDLVMGRIQLPLSSKGVEDFLVTLSEKIHQIALNSVPLKKAHNGSQH